MRLGSHEEMVGFVDWSYNQSMGRPSVRAERRVEITQAFARVLAERGYAGATVVAVAAEAGVAPGLVHHHFSSKEDLIESLLSDLLARLRGRTRKREGSMGALEAWITAALALEGDADTVAARCWVGIFAEAVREPKLFERVRRLVDTEIACETPPSWGHPIAKVMGPGEVTNDRR
jgi:TetR/AcrR family transcriptional regulator, transcriptional repressor of bet genes